MKVDTDAKVLTASFCSAGQPITNLCSWPLSLRRHPGRSPSWRTAPTSTKYIFASAFWHTRPCADAHRRRILVERCNSCANLHDSGDMCSTTSPLGNLPPYHVTKKLYFDSPSTPRSGEDPRTPIGSRSRWGHRGDVRDALDGAFLITSRERDQLIFDPPLRSIGVHFSASLGRSRRF